MKQKKGFTLRNICGDNMIMAEGKENIDFNNIISLNETAAYLWNGLQGQEFTDEDMAEMLLKEYDVDYDTALADSKALAKTWLEAGIITAE